MATTFQTPYGAARLPGSQFSKHGQSGRWMERGREKKERVRTLNEKYKREGKKTQKKRKKILDITRF